MAWLLLVAVEAEARLLIPRLTPASHLAGKPCWQGTLAGRPVWLALTGLGVVHAAHCLTAALERLPEIEAVVNLGCAGAYLGSGLGRGQAALATECVLADWGVDQAQGWRPLEALGLPLGQDAAGRPRFHAWPTDPGLNQLLAAANPGLAQGPCNTVCAVSGDPVVAAVLEARWGAIIEDMESAALALVAAQYARPFACLRGVSNLAGQRELDVAAGAEAAQRALLRLETVP